MIGPRLKIYRAHSMQLPPFFPVGRRLLSFDHVKPDQQLHDMQLAVTNDRVAASNRAGRMNCFASEKRGKRCRIMNTSTSQSRRSLQRTEAESRPLTPKLFERFRMPCSPKVRFLPRQSN